MYQARRPFRSEFIPIRNVEIAQGQGLPEEDWSRGSSVAVIGAKIRDELFGINPAVDGKLIRLRIPELSEERRKDLVKVAKGKGEVKRNVRALIRLVTIYNVNISNIAGNIDALLDSVGC